MRAETAPPPARQAPPPLQVVLAIALREARIAWRRKLVKGLLALNLLSLGGVAVAFTATAFAERQMGQPLGWNPVVEFLHIQVWFVLLLALGLGMGVIARDREHEVVFLYATRPVRPIDYALGKLAAVAGPAAALLIVPGALMVGLRHGILVEIEWMASAALLAQVVGLGLVAPAGLAAAVVGASAVARRERNALLVAIGLLAVPELIAQAATAGSAPPIGPMVANDALLDALFRDVDPGRAAWCVGVNAAWTAAVIAAIRWRIRKEMAP